MVFYTVKNSGSVNNESKKMLFDSLPQKQKHGIGGEKIDFELCEGWRITGDHFGDGVIIKKK